MQEAFVNINDVPTKVVTWGKWIEDKLVERSDIILCIPGNPGITGFYKTFLETIHQQTGYIVWVIAHAGHEKPNRAPPPTTTSCVFKLQAQIDHKAAFIEKYVPDDARLHLIGHSFGAYMSLKLLERPPIKSKVAYSYLLFPTIEKMTESKNGMFIVKYGRRFAWLLLTLAWIFSAMPVVAQDFVLWVSSRGKIPKEHYASFREFFDPYVLRNFFRTGMGIESVRGRDDEVLRDNLDRVKLYYAQRDNWVPASCYGDIKRDIPGIDAEVSDEGFSHSFTMRQSIPVGNMVASWIKDRDMVCKRGIE